MLNQGLYFTGVQEGLLIKSVLKENEISRSNRPIIIWVEHSENELLFVLLILEIDMPNDTVKFIHIISEVNPL